MFFVGLLSHAVVELIVASVYLDPFPKSYPASTSVASLLQVLLLISKYNWKEDPLILDFDSSLTSIEVISIKSSRSSETSQDRSNPMYITSSYDRCINFAPFQWEYEISTTEMNILKKCAEYSYTKLCDIISRPISDIISFGSNSDTSEGELTIESICCHSFILNKCSVVLKFLDDLVKLSYTVNGFTPDLFSLQTFKNTPAKRLSTHNLTVRLAIMDEYSCLLLKFDKIIFVYFQV